VGAGGSLLKRACRDETGAELGKGVGLRREEGEVDWRNSFMVVVRSDCLKGLFVTGSFSRRPRNTVLCLRSRFREKGRSFSVSASSCIDGGRGRFSPETRLVGGTIEVGRGSVGSTGSWDLNGDLETKLFC